MIFDMLKDKMLFIFKRYKYDDNKALAFKDLSFLSKTSSIVITWPFKFITKDESNKNNFDIYYFKDILNRKRSTLTFRVLKKKMIKKPYLIDIAEIDASTYYHLIRNKKNKLFSLIMNEIYNIFNEPFEVISQL